MNILNIDTRLAESTYSLFLLNKEFSNRCNISIILIHKKGEKHKIHKYRPISLSSTLSKVFSKLIGNRVKVFFAN